MASEHEGERGFVTGLLVFLADLGCRHPWGVLVGTLLTCAASLATAYGLLTFQTQRNDLISPSKPCFQRWQQYVSEFGDDDDLVVVVEGANRAEMELALEDLADRLRARPELFDRLFYKVDLRGLRNRSLLFLPVDQIHLIQESLRDMSLLLEPPVLGGFDPLFGWKSLTLQHLLFEAQRRIPAVKVNQTPGEDAFLRQMTFICQRAGEYLQDSSSYRNPWISVIPPRDGPENFLDEPHYFFSEDGTLATLLARPKKDAADGFTSDQKSIDGMRTILAETNNKFPSLKIGVTGLPVLENDEMVASQNDSNFASWLALVGVAILYLVVYRGFRFPLMTVAALLIGTVWAMGWLTVTVGHLNILSSAFAVMLIGMGDYGVLWVSKFSQERRNGAGLEEAIHTTAISVGPGIMTAAMTIALAFYATMLADLKAVAELGWIAGSGVLLCALSSFIIMPALLALLGSRFRPERNADDAAILSLTEEKEKNLPWLPGLTHRPRWILPICLAVTLVLACFALRVREDHNLLHMQAPGLDSVQWEHKLIAKNTGSSWHALSYTTTPEEALALKERYEKLAVVSQVIEVAQLVPRDQQRKLEQLRDIHDRLRRLPERGKVIPHILPSVESLVQTAQGICASLEGHDQNGLGELRNSLLFLLARIKEVEDQPGSDAARRLQEYEQLFTVSLANDLHRLRDVSVSQPIEVADLPPSLRERYIGKTGKWLLRVFAKKELWDFEPLEKFVEQVQTVDPEAAGKPFTTYEGLIAMKNGFFWAGIYAFVAMVVVLLLDFGTCKHTLLALAPLLMGMIATLGLMVLFGLKLNPANIIAFPLVLGVGADNGVHVLHDFRSRDRSQRYSLNFATGWGIMVKAFTTILGFSTLMISQHRGMYSLGLVLTLGVTCCMLTALVFLPTLLRFVSKRRELRQVQAPVMEKRRSA